jgi:hypothetical protein
MTSKDAEKPLAQEGAPLTEMDSAAADSTAAEPKSDDPPGTEQMDTTSPRSNEKDVGQPFSKDDPNNLSEGPHLVRSCTDIPCLLLFVALLGGLFFLGFKALFRSDYRIVMYGKDHDGKVCGVDPEVKDYPFLYWPTITPPPKQQPLYDDAANFEAMMAVAKPLKLGVCTKECPKEYSSIPRVGQCPEKDREHCTWFARNSRQVLGHYCFYKPNNAELDMKGLVCTLKNTTTEEMTKLEDEVTKEMEDLESKVESPCRRKVAETMAKLQTEIHGTHDTLSATVATGDMDTANCKDIAADTDGNFWNRVMTDIVKAQTLVFVFAPLCLCVLVCCTWPSSGASRESSLCSAGL